ncbi:hypothetical protein [Bacillus thuringiensis]|nr:hypothetical protein [Bacillus thuringiensis]
MKQEKTHGCGVQFVMKNILCAESIACLSCINKLIEDYHKEV